MTNAGYATLAVVLVLLSLIAWLGDARKEPVQPDAPGYRGWMLFCPSMDWSDGVSCPVPLRGV